jgi:copper chaperone CopZ
VIQRNHHLAQEVSGSLAVLRGIHTVTVKVVTGSIVIHYDHRVIRSREIIDTLTRAGYFDPSKAITHDDYLHAVCVKTGEVMWKAFFGAFVDVSLEGSALSFIAILL